MLPIVVTIAVILAVLLLNAEQRPKNHREKLVVRLILFSVLFLSTLCLLAESIIPAGVQVGAAAFVAAFLVFRTLLASFWGKVFFQSLLILLLFWCGYLYTVTQLPYGEQPFATLAVNRPKPLEIDKLKQQWLLGLPLQSEAVVPATAQTAALPTPGKPERSALSWQALWPLMEKDARIREVLQNLREKQQQDLTAFDNQLNATSVASTAMRRHALDKENVDDLLKENAISKARYKTLLETWSLLDRDEQAFSERQDEERFHVLLQLVTDTEVDESHKVEFIDYMVKHFAGDIRLFKPLISVYDRLDEEYPRHKRLNQAFLDLYLAKREAVLRGIRAMGKPALQPLLDYRNKTLPTIGYSQARLDDFIERQFGVKVRTLYQTAPAQAVADFLNRKKYPDIDLFSGPSFEQDYIRRTLRQLQAENRPPEAGEVLLGLDPVQWQNLRTALTGRYSEQLDKLLIAPDPAVRANLAWQLAYLKNPYHMPLVLELMRDQNPEVRRLAAIAAGNFAIRDTQGSSDPKFTEIIRMLQNYRSNSDAFGRAWAVTALANIGDKQKALYVIDLILNDGTASQSVVGDSAPTWHAEDKQALAGLVDTLKHTPEELLVKTQALNTLLALESPEALDVLLHYLMHVYQAHDSRPSIWRYLAPHLSLPQAAENVEDVVSYLAQTQGQGHSQFHKRQLKALNGYLQQAYEQHRSGEFFQLLNFLRAFDHDEYQLYLRQTGEHIRIMRAIEYLTASVPFWLVCWPLNLLIALFVSYLILPWLKLEPVRVGHSGNNRANPAAFGSAATAKAPAIVPIKIASGSGDEHEAKHA
ncbi:HEAT repeat domain-containing protein [Methylomonas sp. HYX-M1]|uniref:HEAT repeat domain-containing protein n=1 Tax=Methylomonas sp. HYX-M1 TaxID=3139307 RepID=UPI00345C5D38